MALSNGVLPYHQSEFRLQTNTFINISRVRSADAFKKLNIGKLSSSLLLRALTELKVSPNLEPLVLTQTETQDDQLLQKFWPLDSVLKIYPCSYSLFIDQFFKQEAHQVLLSYVSQATPYEDPRWREIEGTPLDTGSRRLRTLLSAKEEKRLPYCYLPVLVEEDPGATRILDKHDALWKTWCKNASSSAKKRDMSFGKSVAGWSCGVIGAERVLSEASNIRLLRYDLSHCNDLMSLLLEVASLAKRDAEAFGVALDNLGELLVSSVSMKANSYLADQIVASDATTLDFPDAVFGWNPIGSVAKFLATQEGSGIAIIIEKLPYVDFILLRDRHAVH